MAKKGKQPKKPKEDALKSLDGVKFTNPLEGDGGGGAGGGGKKGGGSTSMSLADAKKKGGSQNGSVDSNPDTSLLSQDFLGSFDAEPVTQGQKGKKKGGSGKQKKGKKKGKKKGGGAQTVDDFLSVLGDTPADDASESAPVRRQYSQDEIDRWKKKYSVKKLQKKALKHGVDENAILDAGHSKNKLIDLIVYGAKEDDRNWAQRATAKREANSNASMFKMKSSVNMDFHAFESDAPDAAQHFVKIEEGEEVQVVDYWLDDPEENYVPCTNPDGSVNTDCIWYSLSCPCLWRVAWDSLPTWENHDPDPDDLQQMLVYDDVNSKRIYILAPRANESMHSVQCRNACLYQKLHHPIISIATTHTFNELSKFEKIMVFILGFFLACFLTEGMEKALGLELEEFIGIPAIATFLFFKLFTAIASIPTDLLAFGFPVGKFMDMTLPLAIRAAFITFVLGMAYGAALEQKLVILNLCQFTMVFHDRCDFGLDEIFVAAFIDLLKGMAFEFMFGFTLVFRPRVLRWEVFGFCPPSIPGEMYQAHHKTEFINERGNTDYTSAWKKPWGYGTKGRALVNWMEIRPETQKVAERQKELYIKGAEYAKEQDLKKSQALAKEVEALMSVEEVDRGHKRQDMMRANQMHEATKINALELLKTTLENINTQRDEDVRAAEAIVPDVQADIKAEIKAVQRHANGRANEAGPGFFDRGIFFRGKGRKRKLAAVQAIREEAAADVEMMRAEGVQRVKVATSKATAARIAADDKWLQNTHNAHKRLKEMEDEAYRIYEGHISAAEEESHKRTKKQQARADKAEAQAEAAAEEMEAKRQREEALDRNKDRLREENRQVLETRLGELLEGEAQMALERKRDQWLTALVETGQKHIAAKGGAGVWKHVKPPDNLYLEGEYEQLHIAELHDKVDAAMGSLMEAYKQRDGAKRHKQVMIQMATPKHKPKRRQKQLLKAAEARVEEATREGDALVAKMQENVLNWKGVSLTGLEKMAAEQDEMIKIAEQQLEDLQDRVIEVAKVIMGFGGKIADVVEMDKFQEPERVREEERREADRLAAEKEAANQKKQKKKLAKKTAKADEEEEAEEEVVISLAAPYIKRLRGTKELNQLIEKEKKRDRVDARKAAAEAAEEARRLALSELVSKATEEQKSKSPTAGESKSPNSSPPKGDRSKSKGKDSPPKGNQPKSKGDR